MFARIAIALGCILGIVAGSLNYGAQSEPNAGLCYIMSPTVQGIYIGVTDDYGHTNSPVDCRICFTLWTTNREPIMIDFPESAKYAYEVNLFSTNRAPVPKTALGELVGSKFSDFDASARNKGIRLHKTLAEGRDKPSELSVLFRPSELFKIDAPGTYTLRITFQCIAFFSNGGRGLKAPILIRFPPIEYRVVKPPVSSR